MRTYCFAFIALALVSRLAVAAGNPGAAESTPAADAAPATKPADASGGWDAIDAWVRRGLDARAVLDQVSANRQAYDVLGARKAHDQAAMSLEQCRTCHQNVDGRAPVLDPHVFRVALAGPDTPWIGISVGPADNVLRSQLKLPEGTGVVVTKVVPEGPAQKADVQEHDILLSINGRPIEDGDALDAVVKAAKPDGPPLTLRLLREGQPAEKQIVPSREPQQALSLITKLLVEPSPYRIGVSVSEPDETLRKQLRLSDRGLVVTAVAGGSPAEKQGVKANDVLLSAGGKPMKEGGDLPYVVRQAEETPMELELLRGGVRLKVTVTPEKDPTGEVNKFLSTQLLERIPEYHELTLFGRGVYGVYRQNIVGWMDPDHPQTQPTGAPAERLKQITEQLDQLRAAVEAVRAELANAPTPAVKDP